MQRINLIRTIAFKDMPYVDFKKKKCIKKIYNKIKRRIFREQEKTKIKTKVVLK